MSDAERPAWRQTTRWTAAFALTSVVMSAPYLPLDRVGATPAWGDARIIAWTLAWHARWPATGDAPIDAPLFRPEPRGLVHSEPLVNGDGRSTSAAYDLLRARVADGPGPALTEALRYAGVSHLLVLARDEPEGGARFVAPRPQCPNSSR